MEPGGELAATLLLFGAAFGASPAVAQTTPAAVSSPAPTSAYSQLSPVNQKIAMALYRAQVKPSGASTAMTLDQIAAMGRSGGKAWKRVFETMKTQGLLQEKTLDQVVSRANRTSATGGSSTVLTTANRAYPKSRPEQSLSAEDATAASAAGTSTNLGNPAGRRTE